MTSWRATGACNARCKYCNVDASGKPFSQRNDNKRSLKFWSMKCTSWCKMVGLKGGEPLMRDDIFEIVTYAKALD